MQQELKAAVISLSCQFLKSLRLTQGVVANPSGSRVLIVLKLCSCAPFHWSQLELGSRLPAPELCCIITCLWQGPCSSALPAPALPGYESQPQAGTFSPGVDCCSLKQPEDCLQRELPAASSLESSAVANLLMLWPWTAAQDANNEEKEKDHLLKQQGKEMMLIAGSNQSGLG